MGIISIIFHRFANIMKHGGRVQPLKIGSPQSQAKSKVDGHTCNEETVLVGPLVMVPHGREPFSEPALCDAIGDFPASFFRPDHVYRLAQRRRGEHRSNGGSRDLNRVVLLRRPGWRGAFWVRRIGQRSEQVGQVDCARLADLEADQPGEGVRPLP